MVVTHFLRSQTRDLEAAAGVGLAGSKCLDSNRLVSPPSNYRRSGSIVIIFDLLKNGCEVRLLVGRFNTTKPASHGFLTPTGPEPVASHHLRT